MTPLAGWQNFYVIVGSSAGALIGLQFVAMALIAEMPIVRGQEQAGAAFATPTIIHFSAVLLLSAMQSAPWHDVAGAAAIWRVLGLGGILYEIMVIYRMRSQTVYTPEFEDWLFHALLPLAAYVMLHASAFAVRAHTTGTLFLVAASALLLLFVGIHNAWDAVTYHVFVLKRLQRSSDRHPEKQSSTND